MGNDNKQTVREAIIAAHKTATVDVISGVQRPIYHYDKISPRKSLFKKFTVMLSTGETYSNWESFAASKRNKSQKRAAANHAKAIFNEMNELERLKRVAQNQERFNNLLMMNEVYKSSREAAKAKAKAKLDAKRAAKKAAKAEKKVRAKTVATGKAFVRKPVKAKRIKKKATFKANGSKTAFLSFLKQNNASGFKLPFGDLMTDTTNADHNTNGAANEREEVTSYE